MPKPIINRRKALKFIGLSAGVTVLPKSGTLMTKPAATKNHTFTFCLNMATIRGHKLGFVKELETASKAGFRSVEIWMDSLQTYLNNGGTVKKAKMLLDDLGIKVENSIGFAQWIVDDEVIRKKGIEQMKREMALLAEINCARMAATAMGVNNETGVNVKATPERYRVILELGSTMGIVPILEMWGFTKNISTASETLALAMESGHPSAKILLDVFHLYRGNTPLDSLHLMNPKANDILHMNDYPPTPPYDVITDADRIYPGDGIAPLKHILQILKRNDQPLVLSAELFNQAYYDQDALVVAKTALLKMKSVADGI